METLVANLALGFSVALSFENLTFALLGAFIGTAIGVLPGIGPVATISLLLPITFGMSPTTAIIMLAGIYYGAQYGGSTTAILLNLPGEVSSVVTVLEGYKMARKGRAGAALATAALGSFFAGRWPPSWSRRRVRCSPRSRSPSGRRTTSRSCCSA
jgi:TctA family transporter